MLKELKNQMGYETEPALSCYSQQSGLNYDHMLELIEAAHIPIQNIIDCYHYYRLAA